MHVPEVVAMHLVFKDKQEHLLESATLVFGPFLSLVTHQYSPSTCSAHPTNMRTFRTILALLCTRTFACKETVDVFGRFYF